MRRRLGNFLLLCGLVCLVIFFSSTSFGFEYSIYLFGGVCFITLGFCSEEELKKRTGDSWERTNPRILELGKND